MTAPAPTWGEIEKFLEIDGWSVQKSGKGSGSGAGHTHYEKILDGDRVLRTHVSHSDQKSPSPGRFGAILRYQIEVSRREFWEALKSGDPVQRPVDVEDELIVEHNPWVVAVLVGDLHMTADEIEKLSLEDAQQRVLDFWSRQTA